MTDSQFFFFLCMFVFFFPMFQGSVIRLFFNIFCANKQLCQESVFTAAGKYFGHWKKRKKNMGAKTRLCMLLACGPGSDAAHYTGMAKRLWRTKGEGWYKLWGKTTFIQTAAEVWRKPSRPRISSRICTCGHSMTQVDKRGLHYQGES